MGSDKRAHTSGLLLFATLLLCACGADEPPPQQMAPPDPSKDGLRLSWLVDHGHGDGPNYAVEWHLVLKPKGNFTLTRRRTGQSAPTEIRGAWKALAVGTWELRPLDGRAALKPGRYAEDEWPVLRARDIGPTANPEDSQWKYEVPIVDATTGRFDDLSFELNDPRESRAPPFKLGDRAIHQLPVE